MAELIKDRLDSGFFNHFIEMVKADYSSFNDKKFKECIFTEEWNQLEFKQRIRHITYALGNTLPPSYNDAIEILLKIAPCCKGIEYLFFPDFVEIYGGEHWDISMLALEEFTKHSTAEFSVRAFILQDQEKMMRQMYSWATHKNEHIRRLASEGCRPRLPWATALVNLKRDPAPIFPILEILKEDSSLYVRKSVANNLNDISKDHPDLLKQTVREWSENHPHTDWILKHASRSLLKKGDPEILQLFGYFSPIDITVKNLTLSSDELSLGETLAFSFEVLNQLDEPQNLRIEYGIDFMKANGKQARKIFHLSQKSFRPGPTLLSREHTFKNLSTRKHYGGLHGLCILINGEEKVKSEFMLRL